MSRLSLSIVVVVSLGLASALQAGCKGEEAAPKTAGKVMFKTLKDGDSVKSPLEVCMEVEGLTVEPSGEKKPGHGHHHILIDVPLPELSKPIPADEQHIHMGDGSVCKTVELEPGDHVLRLLFADGLHVPYIPAITAEVRITVAE